VGTTNLVNHHNCKQIADGRKEQAVEVVLHTVADGVAEDVQNNLSDNEEENAKHNVSHWPAVLKGTQNKDNLADKVDKKEDGVDDVRDNEDTDRVLSIQTSPVLEREQGNGATNDEHAEGGQS
jgi:hypothetical protein